MLYGYHLARFSLSQIFEISSQSITLSILDPVHPKTENELLINTYI